MKKLLPYLAFSLLLVVTFLSCEEEPHLELDSPETITEVPRSSFNSRSYVNMDDIPEVIGSLEKRMGSKVSKSGLGLGNKISAKDYEVFLDSIAQVANEGSNTNYTFALDVKGAGPNEFYNLVVGKTPDGEIKDPIVVRYALEQEDMDYFMNGGTDLKRLNAKYSYYNFERFFDENLKMTASGTGDCGSGYIGGGSGGGPTVPPGGSIQTSGFGVTVTTNFQTGHVTTVPYNFNISVTDENGNTEVSTGYATSQNLDGTFATTYGQGDVQVKTFPPTTATINQDTRQQNNYLGMPCTSVSYLDGAGWNVNNCDQSNSGQSNKGTLTAKAGDCEIPEGSMATLTTFTLMILNKTSGYIGLNLANPVDWSRYLWLSHRVIPVCIPINQFVEGEGQSSEAKEFANLAQLTLMDGGTVSFEDHVHLENEQNNPCVKNVLDKLQNKDMQRLTVPDIGRLEGTGHLSQGILDLFDSMSDLDIVFTVAEAGTGKNATTNIVVSGGTPTIHTTIDEEFVQNATQLAIARTIIHESLHGYLLYATSTYSQSETAELINDYREDNNVDLQVAHHEYMTQFVEAIGHSLSVWDNRQHSLEYYNNLAWSGGMLASDTFDQLSQQQQTVIINANIAEGSAASNATNNAKGIKCD